MSKSTNTRRISSGRHGRRTVAVERLEPRTFLSAGGFDGTFGTGGKVVTVPINDSSNQAQAVARQEDGKLLVAGYTSGGLGIVRYNVDGSIDSDFGTNGQVITTDLTNAVAITVLDNDSILVAGNGSSNNSDFGVMRLTSDGTIDTTFGVLGSNKVDFGVATFDSVHAMVVQGDGTIVLAGESGNDIGLARFDANGNVDNTFSGDGKLLIDRAGTVDIANAVVQQSTGEIVVAGETFNTVDRDFLLARVSATGVLDTTFGTNGFSILDFDPVEISNDAAYALTVLDDDTLLAAGHASVSDAIDFAVAKYQANGQPDTSFDTDGRLTTDFPQDVNDPSSDVAHAIAIQDDGSILVAGSTQLVGETNAAVARYSSTGALDAGFGDGTGRLIYGFGTNTRTRVNSVLLQPDGKLVLAGTTGSTFAMVDGGDADLGPANGAGSFAVARLTLATPALSIGNVTQVEGNTGTTTFSFPVTLSVPSALDVTVDYSTANQTAVAGTDYTSVSGTLTIAAGAVSGTISVTVAGDVTQEAADTFVVNLTNITQAVLSDAQGVGTITNDDAAPTITITPTTTTETPTGTTQATFTVTLSNPTDLGPVTVDYTTTGGTATPGVDFQSGSGTVTFAPGETTQTVTVPINGDTDDEPDQTFTVDLSGASGGTIATPSATGTITNLTVRTDVIQAGERFSFVDASGDTVVISLKKKGSASIRRLGDGNVDVDAITVTGSGSKTKLEMKTVGTTTIGQIIASAKIGDIKAKQTTLTDSLSATSSVRKIELAALSSAQIRVAGSIKSVKVGSSDASLIFAGVRTDLSTLPTTRADFTNRKASIGSFRVNNKVFSDTLVAAGKLGTMELGSVTTDNGGETFGLSGDSIEKVNARVDGSKVRGFSKKQSSASASFASGDFVIRLV